MGRRMDDSISTRRAPAAGPDSDRLTRRGALALGAGLLGLALSPGLARAQGFAYAPAPRTTHVVVSKSNRVMELRSGAGLLRRYRIDLGFAPEGHKLASGDGRTPEGRYWIDPRNPRSDFHLSLGISYPNDDDLGRARAIGVDPGGNIFIHGEPVREAKRSRRDWTAGCIAVSNAEMEEIWALTPVGVPVTIFA